MTVKKFSALVLALLMAAALLTGCQQGTTQQDQPQNKKTIVIPAITVDLQAPENRVEVPADEASTVYDAQGNVLTKNQWLLNSKFAKSYIQSLGTGTYQFRYESATATGTINLTITDSQAPDYLFTGELPETVVFLSSLTLPELVKNQDSYQSDCTVSYALKKGEETVALEEDFVTPALTAGSYTWTANVMKDGTSYEFTQSFYVQSITEYLSSMQDELLLDKQSGKYIPAQDGVYSLDIRNNTLDYFYTVNPQVLSAAMTAGLETAVFTVTVDAPLIYGDTGSLWISNGWNGYVFGMTGANPYTDNRLDKSFPNRFISALEIVDGKYVYKGTVHLDPVTFTEVQALTLQFNFARCVADVTVEFK